MQRNSTSIIALVCLLAASAGAYGSPIVGTDFVGRTFAGNVVVVNDYALNGVESPGNLTFVGPSAFMTSDDANDKAIPKRNPPNWSVLIPVTVEGASIELTDVTVSFEAFSNAEATKVGVSNSYSPNYQPTVRLLDGEQSEIDSESLDAWADSGMGNLCAAWTPVFDFVSGHTLAANTSYFIKIEMTGSNGNNVGIDTLQINGEILPPRGTLITIL